MKKANKLYFHGIGVWVILAILTVLFGAFRELIFIPYTGLDGTLARAVLLPIAMAYIIIVTYLFLRRIKTYYHRQDTIFLGLMWLALTIAFEFIFGHYVMGNPWEKLLYDYNILAGRIWILFLLTLVAAPFLVNQYLLE